MASRCLGLGLIVAGVLVPLSGCMSPAAGSMTLPKSLDTPLNLAALEPEEGVGIDLSAPAVAEARERHGGTHLRFLVGDATVASVLAQAGGPFDVILMVNVVTHLDDVQAAFESLAPLCHRRTRIFIYSYSRLWQPVLRLVLNI